ncbi:thioredoxin family protein [Lutibacter sp. TH_r2]|uniref:thioredoxin family protein n=1 Tax=Lutibacter sp. TH_r2 TaxID=3082083 RepID=UPI002953F11F|nr:thioredoxin family protein [Lutibacter sp. TH_r2]MDV7186863.1 thioredoxin family protein [Lutibacter sp. TH_r2]
MNNTLIKNSLEKGISYNSYRKFIKDLLAEEKSTGNIQNEEMLNYSTLNDKRMDRLDKKIVLTEETIHSLNQLNKKYTLLILAEGWCGDAAQILPILNKIAEGSIQLDLKIVLRDENEELMNEYLTNGGKAIPKVLIINKENKVINTWGPRPSIATKMVNDYKKEHGALDAEFKKNLQIWYNKDKGINTQQDILTILKAS